MIDPIKSLEIILQYPDLAIPLFDLMVWAANTPNLKDDNDYDEGLNLVYSHLDQCRAQRDLYAKNRAA